MNKPNKNCSHGLQLKVEKEQNIKIISYQQ